MSVRHKPTCHSPGQSLVTRTSLEGWEVVVIQLGLCKTLGISGANPRNCPLPVQVETWWVYIWPQGLNANPCGLNVVCRHNFQDLTQYWNELSVRIGRISYSGVCQFKWLFTGSPSNLASVLVCGCCSSTRINFCCTVHRWTGISSACNNLLEHFQAGPIG